MTAAKLQTLLDSLPNRVLRKLDKLAKETGESVATIVERGVALYEKRATSKLTRGTDRLAILLRDPHKRAIFEELTAAMGQRSNAKLSAAELKERSSSGGKARAAGLTPEQRSAIAKKASDAAAQKRRELH